MEKRENIKQTATIALMRIFLISISCVAFVATVYFVPAKILGIGFLTLLFISIEYRVIITSKFSHEKIDGNKEANISSVKLQVGNLD